MHDCAAALACNLYVKNDEQFHGIACRFLILIALCYACRRLQDTSASQRLAAMRCLDATHVMPKCKAETVNTKCYFSRHVKFYFVCIIFKLIVNVGFSHTRRALCLKLGHLRLSVVILLFKYTTLLLSRLRYVLPLSCTWP